MREYGFRKGSSTKVLPVVIGKRTSNDGIISVQEIKGEVASSVEVTRWD